MTMRVPNLMNNAQSMLDLQRIKQDYANTVQQLSSGQAIVNLGDNPAGTAQIMNYQSSIDQNDQYVANANTATAQLQTASTSLNSLVSELDRMLTLGQEALSGTATASSQAGIATEVDAIRTNMIALGNTQSQGKYIFAGTNTTASPFTNVPSTGAPNYNPPTVTYQGNNSAINLEVAPNNQVQTNVTGSQVFFGAGGQGSATDLLAQAANLWTGLMNNNTAAIQTAYNNLQSISGQLNVTVAQVGDRANGVTQAQTNLNAFNQTLTTLQSSVASVNYPTAIVNLNQDSVAQQATLSAIAQSNTKNLFSYLA
jgi:flagellar hook-associated protein 3 FlgL